MSGNFAAGRGRRGSAASRRIGRLMGEGVEGRAAALRGALRASRAVLRAVSCRGFRLGRGTADSERRLQSRSAEGERREFCGAGRRSRGGLHRGSAEALRAGGGEFRRSRKSQRRAESRKRSAEGASRSGSGERRNEGSRPSTRRTCGGMEKGGPRAMGGTETCDVGERGGGGGFFLGGEGRKSPNRREKGEGRRSATPSPISQAREASASLRCGIFERLGSVGAAQ